MTLPPAPAGDVAPADYRHKPGCGRLLFRGRLVVGTVIQIRCPKCGQLHVIDTRPASVLTTVNLMLT